jgi:hypothetical protein
LASIMCQARVTSVAFGLKVRTVFLFFSVWGFYF